MTTQEKIQLWQNEQFKQDVRYCANIIALFIESEPNYGLTYVDPPSQIQQRVISYWQKRYNLANRIVQKPEDPDVFKMLMYAISNGNSNNASPVTFVNNEPVYTLWDVNEPASIAGFIKAVFNDLAGVRSSEYPWAGENGSIQPPRSGGR